MSLHTAVVHVIKLVDTHKAKAAFLAPFLLSIGAALASWVATGEFNEAEVRTAVGGAVAATVAAFATYLAKPGRAVVDASRVGPGAVAGDPHR